MENTIIKFLLDKQAKGLPMNMGEAMSKCDVWGSNEAGTVGPMLNAFRKHWEENNK